MEAAVVWRIPLPGTVGVTLVSPVSWFILGAVVLDEGKEYPIIIILKISISANVKEPVDLLLWVVKGVRLAEHGVQHGDVCSVR